MSTVKAASDERYSNDEAIYTVLEQAERPLKTREIYERVQELTRLDYSTVKRKLRKLAVKGYGRLERVEQSTSDGGAAYFYTIA